MSALEDAKAALARLEDPKHGGDWWGWDYAADLEVAIRPLVAEHERLTERLKEAYRVGADGWKHATEQAAEVNRLTTPPTDEWEYGVGWRAAWCSDVLGFRMPDEEAARAHAEFCNTNPDDEDDPVEHFVVRRLRERSAGPWEPVEEES